MRIVKRFLPASNRTAAGFLQEESGSVTIFAIVGFAMCMVIVGLVFDIGRVMAIHTEVSSYADRSALAVARELDGRPGALRDAILAAREDTSVVGAGRRLSFNGDNDIGIRQLTFLSSLDPAVAAVGQLSPMPRDVVTATWRTGQANPRLASGVTADDADAKTRYVIVDTTREREDFMLFPLLGSLTPGFGRSVTMSPQAVAGFDRRMCNITPVMVCNTAEQGETNADFRPVVGEQTRFKLQGRRTNGGGGNPGRVNNWSPTTYSLLDVASRSRNALTNYVSREDPNTMCYGSQEIIERNLNSPDDPPNNDTKTAIGAGFNSRYDDRRRTFTAAVVNCVANRARLNAGQSVPILGYVNMRMVDRIDLDNPNRDDEIELENRGIVAAPSNSAERESRREYPVLVR